MIHEALKYALPILLVSLVSSALVSYGWLKRNTPMGKSYSAMMLVITLWLLFFSMGLLVRPNAYRLVASLEYLTIVALPIAWLIFTFSFAGLKKWLSPTSIFLLAIIPVILLGVALFDFESGLLFNHHKLLGLKMDDQAYPFLTDPWITGWFFLHVAYSVTYFVIGTIVFIRSLKLNSHIDRQHILILILGVLIPWIGNITFIFRYTPIQNLDLAPFIFVMSGALIAWGLFYNQVVNILNIAHNVLIDRMGDGLVVLDKQNWILEINLAALSLFRANKGMLIGHPATHLFGQHPDLIKNLHLSSGKNLNIEIQSGERTRFFILDIVPLFAGKGLFAGKILLFKEVTLLRETEKRLEVAKVQAEKADILKSAFLANLSHEIKTPMNAIIGFSELLNDEGVSDEERHEFIDHIRHSGSNLLHLIDDIIDISKLDAGQIELIKRPIDLSKMMAELFAMVNDSLLSEGKTHVDLILNTELLDQDLTVQGDPERIRQVVTNLLDNAVKFTKRGTIEFGYYLENTNQIKFFVKDTGIGIPYDKHSIIFERFGRVNTTNKQEQTGTGLGLALCKGLVSIMGGRIGFDSVLGKGSTFYFYVPYQPSQDFVPDVKPLTKSEFVHRDESPADLVMPTPEPIIPQEPEKAPHAKSVPEPVDTPDSVPAQELEPAQEPEPIEKTEQDESIRDHFTDLPEDADLIFSPDMTPKSTIEDETNFAGTKLLVIDFEDMAYLFIEMILRPTKIQIIRAKTLQQGLNLLRGGTIVTGVLVSSDLPDAEIIPAIRSLKGKYPRIRQIAITPFASQAKRRECLAAGASNVVPKPIKQRELLAAVRNLHVLSQM